SEELIVQLALAYNEQVCDPPMSEQRVRSQVRGAMKMAERAQEPDAVELRRVAQEFEREFLAGTAKPTPASAKQTKSPQVLRRPLSTVTARKVEYLIAPVVPRGAETLVAGVGGLGKTALVLVWAKQVTDAGGDVLIVSYEDSSEHVLRPRLEALGADLGR